MLDLHIRGATIVDGTGAPSRPGDIGVRDGRIAALGGPGTVDEPAARTIDAAGLVACPGFVDPHTHYDAQLFWDPFASPSNVHGVTSVVGGNCSFGLTPLREVDADYTRRMMAKVEGIPLAALEEGVPWTWHRTGEYLDALDGRIAVNAGFLVGHSALRRYVLGPEANERAATPDELDTLIAALADGLVPARGATTEEVLALCAETGRHPGTTLAGIFDGASDGFRESEIELLTAMSAAANRPLNWNVLVVDARDPSRIDRQLAASRHARMHGGRIVALTMPVIVPMNMSFRNYCALNLMPGWGPILNAPIAERIQMLRDEPTRRMMVARADSEEAGMFRRLADFAGYLIGDTHSPANHGLSGRIVRDIAAQRNADPFDTLVDIVITDDLHTVLWPSAPDDDDAHWALRRQLWDHEDVLLGGSDAGAHVDRMCGGCYPTQFIDDTLRGRQLVSLERAIHMLTDAPARLLGLRDRGRVAEGWFADLVLFDRARVGAAPARLLHDLPGGSVRMTADSAGIAHVFVNGVETVRDGAATGTLPGRVLRSGRDTDTVAAR
jgi:N-acyl-D-aspartate/D-glutamate deacylase